MNVSDLPIFELKDGLNSAVRGGGLVVVEAPTGSGKSTQVPQWVTAWKHGTVIVLEPRRVAARLLARRVAEEMGVSLGQEVGYHVRFDRKCGPKTRLQFVTDGILLRRMLNDPELEGVSAVIFDEFHERHLESDLTLSLLREQVEGNRPDLSLVVMSATLDLETLEQRLGPCPVLNAEGRMYPVDLHYLERNLNPQKTPIWEAAAEACADCLRVQESGSILVFMPGQREIHRTIDACRRKGLNRSAELLELHGGLPLDLQAKTLREGEGRKIIISTNIAESSVTVPNVVAVVDSGLARIARFDAGRAMDTLHIQPVSQSSADQRSGRAGRTRPGMAYRLWTESAHQARPAHTLPEIHRCDLAPALLQIATLRGEGLDAFPWFEPPEDTRLEQARRLLRTLNAVDELGQVTRLGRDLAQLPVHPRYARFLRYTQEHGGLEEAVIMVALAQAGRILLKTKSWEIKRQRERKLPEESDCDAFQAMEAFHFAESSRWNADACRALSIHQRTAMQADRIRGQLMKLFGGRSGPKLEEKEKRGQLLRGLLAGFADQLAQRTQKGGGRFKLAGGRDAVLDEDSVVRNADWVVALDIQEIGNLEGQATVRITSAAAIPWAWIEETFGDTFEETSVSFFEPQTRRVLRTRNVTFQGLVLKGKQEEETDPDRAAAILAEAWMNGEFTLQQWNQDVEKWIHRCNLLARLYPEYDIRVFDGEARRTVMEQFVYGAFRVRALKDKPILPVLKNWLSAEQQGLLEHMLPDRLVLPSGASRRLTYPEEGPPVLKASIQDCFGLKETPMLAEGRQPVLVHLLAPNRRPVQITQDLAGFWQEHYPGIRNQLSKRYPKHKWPEHPE